MSKWALPFSAFPLSYPQHVYQAKLGRCQWHARGSPTYSQSRAEPKGAASLAA